MDTILFEILRNADLPHPRGILQVGASYGQELDAFREAKIKAVILVEPLPEPFVHIAEQCKKLPGFIAVNALCSDAAGQPHQFYVSSNGGQSSSILKPK